MSLQTLVKAQGALTGQKHFHPQDYARLQFPGLRVHELGTQWLKKQSPFAHPRYAPYVWAYLCDLEMQDYDDFGFTYLGEYWFQSRLRQSFFACHRAAVRQIRELEATR